MTEEMQKKVEVRLEVTLAMLPSQYLPSNRNKRP
jgi:hypothetical protein